MNADIFAGVNIIPADRRIDWKPGIPGGIPTYSNGPNVKNFGAKGDGTTDDTAAIKSAIAAATNGQAVYFPEGTYKITDALTVQGKSIVLRGAGPDKTVLLGYVNGSTYGMLDFRGGGYSEYSVTAGYQKDSTVLTISPNTNPINVGDTIIIFQDNDPLVIEGSVPSFSEIYQAQMVQVQSKGINNTLNLTRPLYYTYNSSKNVRIRQRDVIQRCGVEDLKILMLGTADVNIFFFKAQQCWVKNVESINSNWQHVALGEAMNCEIRNNFFHHARTYGQGGYGISVGDRSTDNLVEDNIFHYLRHSIVIQNGATGNVLGYNFSSRAFDAAYPNTDYLGTDLECHGGNPNMNLFEGNKGTEMMTDNYWGSSRNNTYFRNYASRYSEGEARVIRYGIWAARVDAYNLYMNFVGNVLSNPESLGTAYSTTLWLLGLDSSRTLSSPNIGPGAPVADARVSSTLIRHGNFDYISGQTDWMSTIADHVLPDSYYLTSKPSFFGSLPWPSIGPDLSTMVGELPAENRFKSILPLVNKPNIISQPANQITSLGIPTTFSVQANGTGPFYYQWYIANASSSWNYNLIPGATDASYTFTPTDSNAHLGAKFYCSVTNYEWSVATTQAVLTIGTQNSAPTISAQPLSRNINAGENGAFSVVASGNPTPTYQWKKDGIALSNSGTISGATTNTLSIINAANVDAGNYTCVVTNSIGSVTTTPATLSIVNPPVPPTGDTQAPTVPTGLIGSAVSSSQINLTWTASTDDVGVTGYRIYKDGAGTPIGTVIGTSFQINGLNPGTNYSFQVDAMDAARNSSAKSSSVIIKTLVLNLAPTVSAGVDQTIVFPTSANLDGTVQDDNLPSNTLTQTWSKVSGPGTVTFGNASSVDTTATFSQAGNYVLGLTASDGSLSSLATVSITVQSPNQPPSVSAGPDQTINLSDVANLSGTVSDDGLPNGTTIRTWKMISGPGSVTFGNGNNETTSATFSKEGLYVLELSANDGLMSTQSSVRITVLGTPPPTQNLKPDSGFLSFKTFLNPTQESMKIQYLAKEDPLTLLVFDRAGNEIKKLQGNNGLAIWDGRNESGTIVPSGIYLVQLKTNGLSMTQKIVVVK